MKTGYLLLLAVALLGCSRSAPQTTALTPDQAANLARGFANEQAQVLYKCQPFQNGPPARFLNGYWVWHDRRARGTADIEATVELARDGAKSKVHVVLLDSRPAPPGPR